MDRNEAMRKMKAALKARSGKSWSVTGGRGTSWGWISISAPPKRLDAHGYMTAADAAELGKLLGFDRPVHQQGESIAASTNHYLEYVARAEGRTPEVHGVAYWD
jgi:hypothetical protein